MGALAGGAAGAFGGHQVGHGFIGGVGGAIGGSMLEDAYKKKKKKDKYGAGAAGAAGGYGKPHKQNKQRRGSGSSSSSSSSSSDSDSSGKKHRRKGEVPLGNFRASSRDVHLEHGCVLVAECADVHGHHRSSSLNLNDCLTNKNGRLRWARGGNFATSARHLRLVNDGKRLVAEVADDDGNWNETWVSLNKKITNDNGVLKLL
jgi:hypothetical protein